MVKIKILKQYEGVKISQYIQTLSNNLTITSSKRHINNGNVKVNEQKVKDNYILKLNDELTIYLPIKKTNDRYLKTNLKIPIFYEDENIIILDKPKNVSCQENENEKINTLNNFVKKYCYQKQYWNGYDVEFEPCLVHRIDQNTSGLVIAAKNKEVARILNKNINNQISKKYLAVIYGKPNKNSEVLLDYIKRDNSLKNKMLVFDKQVKDSHQIKTKYKLVYTNNKYSILEVELFTGKKHQIRAHLAFHKMYIVGDNKYGIKNKDLKLNSQLLISNKIEFNLENQRLKYLSKLEFIKFKDYKKLIDMIK